jgi:hypothetical protein
MVDKVVVEFGEKDHIRGIRCIGFQMHIGMRNESLFERVESDNPASTVIEGIRRLLKIRAPTDETKLGKASLYVFENVFLDHKNLSRNRSAALHGYC